MPAPILAPRTLSWVTTSYRTTGVQGRKIHSRMMLALYRFTDALQLDHSAAPEDLQNWES